MRELPIQNGIKLFAVAFHCILLKEQIVTPKVAMAQHWWHSCDTIYAYKKIAKIITKKFKNFKHFKLTCKKNPHQIPCAHQSALRHSPQQGVPAGHDFGGRSRPRE